MFNLKSELEYQKEIDLKKLLVSLQVSSKILNDTFNNKGCSDEGYC